MWAANDDLARAAADWNERPVDHTGTAPLMLPYGEDEDADVAQDDDEEVPVVIEGHLSVVSRWDLAVADSDALMVAGRAAHGRLRSEETEEDAVAAVWNLEVALYSIAHEMPVPWRDVDGVMGASGTVAYIVPDQPLPPPPDGGEDVDLAELLEAPSGDVVFLETWS